MSGDAATPSRLEQWEKRTELPLLLLALAFLIAYAWPVIDPRLDADLRTFLTTLSWTVWSAFVFDFVVRLTLAHDRRAYLVTHWYDVLLVVIPALRPLRLLRLLTLVRVLDRLLSKNLAGRAVVYVVGTSVFACLLGAVAVLDAERDVPGANITSLGDALWWALTTVTTVGYGDYYPVTTEGRIIAGMLMIIGIGLVGTVTAGAASWFITRVEHDRTSRPDGG